MNKDSSVLRYLLDEEINILRIELSYNKDSKLWGPHGSVYNNYYNITGPLRHGKTIWIRAVDSNLKLNVNSPESFPYLLDIVNTLAGNNDYARCYLHSLAPNNIINEHVDVGPVYFNQILHRYHIYLDIPKGVQIKIDNQQQDTNRLKNCILDFNWKKIHSYKNNSNEDFTFAVFDILTPNLRIKLL
jgi:hypothetical protein